MATRNTQHELAADHVDELLTTEAAASRVGLSPVTLKVWRWQENPHAPPHITVGSRNIRYSARAIEQWKVARTHKPGTKTTSKNRSPSRQQGRPGPR